MQQQQKTSGIKPRFFVIMTVLLCLVAFGVYKLTSRSSRLDVVFTAESDYEQALDSVVIRDEKAFTSTTTVRVDYVAAEDTFVYEGDTIANLFSTGYTQSLLTKLESTRENIQTYHKTLLGTIVDSSLDRLDSIVEMTAEEFRNVANGSTQGNLRFTVSQLETAMSNRQEYLRQNKRDDTKLTKLYDEENSRLNAISAWQTAATAESDGVVSFYLDGYETDLTPDTLSHLTVSEMETVLAGGDLTTTADTRSNGIYRLVDQEKWYVAVLSEGETWNPTVGQEYYLQLQGYDDLVFTASVISAQKNSGKLLAVFEIDEPMGAVIYARAGKATVSISLTSLAVHTDALDMVGGETGVWVYDGTNTTGTFVPVQVLSRDGDTALIEPSVEGALENGTTVIVK